jgi:hypothetical protein
MSSSGRRASPLVVAFAFGAAVAGCGLVVGSGDYVVGSVVEAGSDDSPGVASPDAQTSPDTSGPVSEGGTSEAGPTSVCGPGGVLVPGGLPTGDATFQQLVDACVLAVSCDPLFFDVTVSDCITNDFLDTYPTKCLASIKSCDDYYACMGSRVATLAECQGASNADHDTGSCNGQTATNCYGSGDGIISNCATLGGTCTVYEETDFADLGNIAAGCEIASCTDSTDGIYCGGTSQVYTCEGTDTGPDLGISRQTCPAGSACQTSSAGGQCFKTTSSCATPGTSCTNGELTTCIALPSGNQQYTSNCSVAGLACSTDVSGNSACTAMGCANAGCTESCMGKSLQACIGGAPYVIDCGALGFNTCDSGTNIIGTAYAYCAYQ